MFRTLRPHAAALLLGALAVPFAGAQPAAPATQPAPQVRSGIEALDDRLGQVDYDRTPLRQVLRDLAARSGTNVVVFWPRLEEAGVLPDAPVTLHVRNLRLGQVLRLVLAQVAPVSARLGFRAEEDMIVISSLADLDRELVVRVYDVRDLIGPEPVAARLEIGRLRQVPIGVVPAVAPGAVGVQPVIGTFGSGVVLEMGDVPADAGAGPPEVSPQMRQLINLITATVEPQTWAVNGGAGTIVPYGGLLVVRNSPRVHALLASGREPATQPAAGAAPPGDR